MCGAKNEMNKDGDKVDGVVYLNMETGEFLKLPLSFPCLFKILYVGFGK